MVNKPPFKFPLYECDYVPSGKPLQVSPSSNFPIQIIISKCLTFNCLKINFKLCNNSCKSSKKYRFYKPGKC
jgi:hypothetical protein